MQVQVFTMSIYSNKEKMEGNDYKDICRNHSAKADREMYRVCPSKLSKRELEDLYFTLLENNLELKKTINGQNDKIRLLSTQVQRMTNTQDKLVSKAMKDCGTATKAVVDGQKDFISELKDTNKSLSDRIQQLNMKLCSAKQFPKTSPQQTATSRGNRSTVMSASTPKKHECCKKSPESLPERVLKVSTYSQWEDKRPFKSDRPCDENKCRTLMEELKQKIATLQDELFNVHGEYATRIGRLETEVLEVRKENIQVKSERSTCELERMDSFKRTNDLLAQYRTFEAQCSELTTELAIERRKVTELETRLKAANLSDKVNKTIEDHLSNRQETSGTPDGRPRVGALLEGCPQNGSPHNIATKNGILQEGETLDVTPQTDFSHDGSSRDDGQLMDISRTCECGCPPPTPPTPDTGFRDGIVQDGDPLDISPRDGDPRDDDRRDGGPRIFSPRDGTPFDAGVKDGILQDGDPLDVTPRAGFRRDRRPRDGGPGADGLQDSVSQDAESRDGRPQVGESRDARPRDGRPRDGKPRDGRPRDGGPGADGLQNNVSRDGESLDERPQVSEPRDGRPRDHKPRDGRLRNGRPRDGRPRDGRPRDGGPEADGLQDSSVSRDGRPQVGESREGRPRDGRPRDGRPRDGKPRDGGPGADGFQDSSLSRDGRPQVGDPLDGRPRDGRLRDGRSRDGRPRDGNLRDDGPGATGIKDGILEDCNPLCVNPQGNFPQDSGPRDGGLPIFSPRDGSARDDRPRDGAAQDSVSRNGSPRDDSSLKCHCGCPPTPPIPPTPPRFMNEKTPIKNLHPMLPLKKRNGLDDSSTKSSPTKYSMASSTSKYSCSYATATTSEDTNCEKCGCKWQLTRAMPCPTPPVQPVQKPPPVGQVECDCKICACPPPYHLTTLIKNGKCAMCGYNPPETTSTPVKTKKKEVDCRCPVWMQDLTPSQENNPKCMKCCFKDELESTSSPPSKTDEGLPATAGPTYVKNDLNTSNTNDSGYQDTDEQGLLKHNKELMAMILDLQRQIDVMKIGQVCRSPGCKPIKPGENPRSPVRTALYSRAPLVPPLLEELPKVSEILTKARTDAPETKDTVSIDSGTSLLGDVPQVSEVLPKAKQSRTDFPDTKDTASIHSGGTLLGDIPQVYPQPASKPSKPGENPRSSLRTAHYSRALIVPPLFEDLPKVSEILPKAKHARTDSPETKDTASVHSGTSILGDLPQITPVEKVAKVSRDYDSITQIPSEDSEIHPRKILRIEVLGNPQNGKASSLRKQTPEDMQATTIDDTDDTQAIIPEDSDDTRAKTIEDSDGTLQITDDPKPIHDKYGYPDLPPRERSRLDSPKFEIVEKRKLEIAGISRPDSDKVSLKSATSSGPGPGFNPEKFKYLEAEGLTTTLEAGIPQEESFSESIPSNPELGFGIPRLASKGSQPDQRRSNLSLQQTYSKQKVHMREVRLANHPTQIDNTDKPEEDCTYCAVCSYDKECADTINPIINNLALGIQKNAKKQDDKTQGPMPLLNTAKKEKKRNIFSHFRKHKKESEGKEDLIIDPTTYAQRTCDTSVRALSLDLVDVPILEKKTEAVETQSTLDKSRKRRGSQTKGDLIVNPRLHAQRTSTTTGVPVHLADVEMLENAGNKEQKPLSESSQTSRDLDSAWQRDVPRYRRRSGTYLYRTTPLGQVPLACRCVGRQGGACPKLPRNKGTQVLGSRETMTPREKRRAGPMSDRGTYTLSTKQTDTSPDNTDLDYLSDLPSEKEKKSPPKSRTLSPGEDRATTYTSTSSGLSPRFNNSLSEGEMPATSRPRSYSSPEIDRPYLNATLAHKLETPPAQQMEAALQAITDELQRCKNLLQQQRPLEQPIRSTCSVQTAVTDASNPIALKPGVALQGIGDTQASVSVFTLHIGTVVLSDEAVLNSRDKNLVLKWKFYDQAVTMSRMHAGRVMLFDFSTEYDIKVTENFLNYLKYEQMPIVICEIGHEELPFAYSALPLRDALLHTNTRVDMSIALMAGPQLKDRTQGMIDSLDGREEVGVIDLWCMLRADTIMVPGINLAIAQPGAAPMSREQRHSGVMPPAGDDCNELDLTTMARSEPVATHEQTGKNQTYADVGYARPSDTWSNPRQFRPPGTDSTASQTVSVSIGAAREASYDPSRYPPLRDRTRTPSHTKVATVQSSNRLTPGKNEVSEMIINEVKPKIKTPEDVKYALETSNRLNDSKSGVSGAIDPELLSQAHSSYGSIRSVISRLQKRGSRYTQTHGGDQRNFIEKLRKASKTGVAMKRPSYRDEASDMEIYKKYENITKLIGQPNRPEQSKKVTIQPEYFESEVEKPEKDVAEGERTDCENQKRTAPQLEITVLWLALNEECEAMIDPHVQRVYVAYTFLGRSGADLETPVSLPKPKHYVEKCYFNFKKVFELEDADFPKLGHMARCRASNVINANSKDCIIFSVVSEPSEDPLGIESCEDIGYAFLYLGDLLAYSAGSPGYTEVIPVRAARGASAVTGVLAVRMDGLDVVRRCLLLISNENASRSRPM